jgi:propanediol dehydratase large subunit
MYRVALAVAEQAVRGFLDKETPAEIMRVAGLEPVAEPVPSAVTRQGFLAAFRAAMAAPDYNIPNFLY